MPDLVVEILDVIESTDAGLGDERFHVVSRGARAGDADEVHPTGERLLHRCDRTGFATARRSPRGPEPQHEILTRVVADIEGTTADEGRRLVEELAPDVALVDIRLGDDDLRETRVGRRGVRYRKDDVLEWLRSREVAADGE